MQVFDGDMAYLHQTGVVAKNQHSSLDRWTHDYFLASEADRYITCMANLLEYKQSRLFQCFMHVADVSLDLLLGNSRLCRVAFVTGHQRRC